MLFIREISGDINELLLNFNNFFQQEIFRLNPNKTVYFFSIFKQNN